MSADTPERCVCGNEFDGDNLCMVSACQWEGIPRPAPPHDDYTRPGVERWWEKPPKVFTEES